MGSSQTLNVNEFERNRSSETLEEFKLRQQLVNTMNDVIDNCPKITEFDFERIKKIFEMD